MQQVRLLRAGPERTIKLTPVALLRCKKDEILACPANTCHRPECMLGTDPGWVWCPACGDSWDVPADLYELCLAIEDHWNEHEENIGERLAAEHENRRLALLDTWRVVCADSGLPEAWPEGVKVNAAFTSPRYNRGFDYGVDALGRPISDKTPRGEYLSSLYPPFRRLQERMAPPGALYVNLKPNGHDPMLPFDVLQVLQLAGWSLQHPYTWVKSATTPNGAQGMLSWGHHTPTESRRWPHSGYEWVFLFRPTGWAPVDLDRRAIGVPYAYQANRRRFTATSGGEERPDVRCRGDVWAMPYKTIQKRGGHPCPFPVGLVDMGLRQLRLKPGDTVADPFCGSGATLLAAQALGFRGLGIDLSAQACREAVENLRQYQTETQQGSKTK